ncbi:MAG: alpha-ketoacid dehydrogenase subunit beta [Candidatus Sericytochromatia bacterium]|nr:alpha-ketoacid dehydrogenase subunit beta [Candidatus Sericytochromatia bacterium]
MAVITYRDALRQAIAEEMRRDPAVWILGQNIAAYGGTYAVTKGLYEEFGAERVRDTPIAEAGIIGLATGSAMGGTRPIAEIMSINFTLVAIDQIVNHAAKMRYMFGGQWSVPMVIRTSAGYGMLAATHSQTFENWYAYVPGLKVVMPATPYDAKGMLKAAIRDSDPVMFIEHSNLYGQKGEVPEEDYVLPLDRADIKRAGEHLTLVCWSSMVKPSLAVAETLAGEGISVEVIDMRALRPLDTAAVIASVKKTNRCVIAEEGWRTLGIGAEIAARVSEEAFDWLDAPVGRVGGKEVPMPYAKNLEKLCVPSEFDILAACRAAL